MKDIQTFAPGDVCFGKVRGFPAWPARVVALAEESSVKQCKYHVSFFGTGESGLLKGDEMHSYFANKAKLTKNVKRKGFQKGLEELEQYILDHNICPADGELDRTPADIPQSDLETPGSEKPKVPKVAQKRPAIKRFSEPIEKRPRPSIEPTPTSRSGRKIRPKKFSDEFEGDEPAVVDANNEDSAAKIPEATPQPKRAEEAADELVDGDRPVSESVPERKKRGPKAEDRAREEERKERKRGKLIWFRIEKRLLELDIQIRSSLGMVETKVDKALAALDELGVMIIDPLMLKKHPQIVETVKKLRSYVGNISCWNLSDEEAATFPQITEQIRHKADFVYNKMKTLFVVPPQKTFWQVFSQHVEEFTLRTKDWDPEQMYELTQDPEVQEIAASNGEKPAATPKSNDTEVTNGNLLEADPHLSAEDSPVETV